ncbi:FAD:protein FMN transferase [soil metagenome]
MLRYYNFAWLALVTCFLLQDISLSQDVGRYQFQSRHMGTQISIILYAENEILAKQASDAAFERIEELNQIMSDYVDESELNRLSQLSGSGEWMEINDSFFEVLKESKTISENTGGLFDVTIGPMTHNWRYIRMQPEPHLPAEDEVESLKNRVGYQHIELDGKTGKARLMRYDMQLDFGGIAKGCAAKEAVNVLNQHGIHSALVDAGGDITAGNPPPNRTSWDVAIPKGNVDGKMKYVTLQFSGETLTTSGDMYHYVEIDGVRYSHILNPKTGIGATGQIQATVISSNSMWADAYASALTLMEPEKGIRLIESLNQTEAIIFMKADGEIREWHSSGIPALLKPE